MGGALLCGLWSCSSDNTPDNPGTNLGATTGDAYMALQINLPQNLSTRAGEYEGQKNDQFNDGTSNEYTVKDATLVLFDGQLTNEKSATFVGAYKLQGAFTETPPGHDNITSSSLAYADVSGVTIPENLLGLVMLNRPTDVTLEGSNLKIGSKTFSKGGENCTFKDLLKTEFTSANFYTPASGENAATNFFMTNAPLSNNIGGADNPTSTPTVVYLSKLTSTTYPNANEAKDNTAGCIYVERAVAKANVTTEKSVTIEGVEFNVTVEWKLSNTNPGSYLIRNVNTDVLNESGKSFFAWNYYSSLPKVLSTDKYRFIGSAGIPNLYDPFHTEVPNPQLYRTYWCNDVNYNTDATLKSEDTYVASNKPLYCNENTFDVAHMNHKNTTMAMFKVTMTPTSAPTDHDKSLYILNGDKTKIYTTAKAAESKGVAYIYKQDIISNGLQSVLEEGQKITEGTNYAFYLDVTYGTDKTGNFKPTGVVLNPNAEVPSGVTALQFKKSAVDDFQAYITNAASPYKKLSTIFDEVAAYWEITKYVGGVSYYAIPVQHFGETSTPWTADGEKEQITTGATYGKDETASKNYLGRYGMVRNNWYELSITNIMGLGDTAEPDITTDMSDDNNKVKKYIAVEVHTFSWAKRTQGIVLGK